MHQEMTKNYQQKVAFSLIELVYVFPPQFRHSDFITLLWMLGNWYSVVMSDEHIVSCRSFQQGC